MDNDYPGTPELCYKDQWRQFCLGIGVLKIGGKNNLVRQVVVIIGRHRHDGAQIDVFQHLYRTASHEYFFYCGRPLGTHE